MAQKNLKVWYDPQGDFLEVTWEHTEGDFRPTQDDRVREKVDTDGNVLGFRILRMSTHKDTFLDIDLPGGTPSKAVLPSEADQEVQE